MKVNISELQTLIEKEFRGNQTAFSETLNIDRTHLNKILKHNGKGAGLRFCEAVMKYCTDNNKDYKRYIFFNNSVHTDIRKEVNRNGS